MKYKVGDVVKLRDDLDLYTNYGYGWQCNSSMLELKGQKVTITTVWANYYDIAEDDGQWGWTDAMIEGLWEECKSTEQVSKSEDSSVNSSVNKYRLIDVLNKIANGELKEGTKVIHLDNIYIYKKYGDKATASLYRQTADSPEKDFFYDERHRFMSVILNEEVKLIEPDHFADVGEMVEPTEVKIIEPKCNHEWRLYTLGRLGGKHEYHRICKNCGIDEEIEPTDNTKIEELDKEEMLCLTLQCAIAVLTDKLNEVISKLNKEDNNE